MKKKRKYNAHGVYKSMHQEAERLLTTYKQKYLYKTLFLFVAILMFFKFKAIFVPLMFLVLTAIIHYFCSLTKLDYFGTEPAYFAIFSIGFLFGPKVGMIWGFIFVFENIWYQGIGGNPNFFSILTYFVTYTLIGYVGSIATSSTFLLFGMIVVVLMFLMVTATNLALGCPFFFMVQWGLGLIFMNYVLFSKSIKFFTLMGLGT